MDSVLAWACLLLVIINGGLVWALVQLEHRHRECRHALAKSKGQHHG